MFSVLSDPVAVVDAPAYHPHDLLAADEYELPALFGHRYLFVDQKVADSFVAVHPEGDERVALVPSAQFQRPLQQIGVQ
jgi:diphthamide synthase subunit DPH2